MEIDKFWMKAESTTMTIVNSINHKYYHNEIYSALVEIDSKNLICMNHDF